jgi:hypothetical protein
MRRQRLHLGQVADLLPVGGASGSLAFARRHRHFAGVPAGKLRGALDLALVRGIVGERWIGLGFLLQQGELRLRRGLACSGVSTGKVPMPARAMRAASGLSGAALASTSPRGSGIYFFQGVGPAYPATGAGPQPERRAPELLRPSACRRD